MAFNALNTLLKALQSEDHAGRGYDRRVCLPAYRATSLVAFGAVATMLAVLGMYGVIAYAVTQRTREIGIRMAIGARPSDVARMFLARGVTLTAIGVVVGVGASVLLTRLIESQLFGVRSADPAILAIVAGLMTSVAAAAAYLPARGAAEVDPIVALRTE